MTDKQRLHGLFLAEALKAGKRKSIRQRIGTCYPERHERDQNKITLLHQHRLTERLNSNTITVHQLALTSCCCQKPRTPLTCRQTVVHELRKLRMLRCSCRCSGRLWQAEPDQHEARLATAELPSPSTLHANITIIFNELLACIHTGIVYCFESAHYHHHTLQYYLPYQPLGQI